MKKKNYIKVLGVSVLCVFILSCFAIVILVRKNLNLENYTNISEKAAKIKLGAYKKDVVSILGKPQWIIISGEKGEFEIVDERVSFDFYWHNPGHSPVVFSFDKKNRVTAKDEGWQKVKTRHMYEPPDKFSSKKTDRARLCK